MRWFMRKRNFEREMADELAAHIEHRADDLHASGLPRDAAIRQARIELGAVETYKESMRDERVFGRTRRFFEQTGRDLKHSLRRHVKAPGFALFAIASIGIGAGVTTAVFSMVYALCWTPTPIKDSATVGMIVARPGNVVWDGAISMGDFLDYRAAQTSFETVDASARVYQSLSLGDRTDLVIGEAVTGTYFKTLGIDAALGRVLQPEDDRADAAGAALLSDQLWRSRFAADPNVIGRPIRFGGAMFAVVGIAPRDYQGLNLQPGRAAQLWISLAALAHVPNYNGRVMAPTEHTRGSLAVFGRLRPGTTIPQASAQADAIGKTFDQSFPVTSRVMTSQGPEDKRTERRWIIDGLEDAQKRGSLAGAAGLSVALMTIIALVLAVACTNVANLALARGAGREHEFAVRTALGASRSRLIRELCAEAVVIGIPGFIAALLVSVPLARLATIGVPLANGNVFTLDAHLNGPAVFAALAAVGLALVVCTLWPAVRLSRADVRTAASKGAGATPPWRSQRALIRAQVIVSVAFFNVAALCIASLLAQAKFDPGIDLEHLTAATAHFRLQVWDEARTRRAVEAIVSEPPAPFGARVVALSSTVPFGSNMGVSTRVSPIEREPTAQDATKLMCATPGIFDALGIPIIKGRAFDARDTASALPVAVLSEASARELFGTTDIIGRVIHMRGGANSVDAQTTERRTVIGIARDVASSLMTRRVQGMVFVPFAQRYEVLSFVLAANLGSRSASLQALIAKADPDVALASTGSGIAMFGEIWYAARILAVVSVALGAITLLLTMSGLFGVLSHVVISRTREIGIRKALGANGATIRLLIMLDGARPVVSGAAIGWALGVLGGFVLRSFLRTTATPFQPIALAIVVTAVVPATIVACYLPARRAMRVDPNIVLKDL